MLAKLLPGAGGFRGLPTFVSSSANNASGATSVTVTAPSGIQDGDLLVAITYTNAAAAITTPSGFSQLTNEQAANPYVVVSTKTAASESGNYTFNSSVSANFTAAILVYRNATRVNTVGSVNRLASATASATSITPTYVGTLIAAFTHSNSGATVSGAPSGMTLRASVSGPPNFRAYDLANQAASATGNKGLLWSTSGTVSGLLLQVTNEPDVAPEFIASASTQNTTIGASLVIAKPTGTVEGDLMVAVMAATVTATWTGDTGWLERADLSVSPSLRIATKTAGASEPSSYTFTVSNSSTTAAGCILTYRYAEYDTIAGAFTTAANPLVLSSASPSLSQGVLIAAGARVATSVTLGTPTSMTARVTDNNATAPSYIVCDQVVAKGPTGTRSMSTGSTTNVAGIMLAIKPTRGLL